MKTASRPRTRQLQLYLSDIHRIALLTVADEQILARAYRDEGDARAGHRLIAANLRFVVKIAREYRSYGFELAELVQEGNIGLMRAVSKFDPDRDIRLISYAVWWIRSYIQSYVLRSFSLVKLGTTQAQRRLFFSLARTRRELDRTSAEHGSHSDGEDCSKVAAKLKVKPAEVVEMTRRMVGRDLSLDAPIGRDGGRTHLDLATGRAPSAEEALSMAQEQTMVKSRISSALTHLDHRERYIMEMRVMTDQPMTLRDLGVHFGCSRERARQLELRAKEKLKQELSALPAEIGWPTDGQSATRTASRGSTIAQSLIL
jgi:RNA polymerase sigma-32 factor